jgi:hypothetical protein
MKLDGRGKLTVRTYTAGGALPISDATIRISGAMEENSDIVYSLITDIDGLSEKIELPTSALSYSQAPNPPEIPYAIYDIEVLKEGYYNKKIYSLPIFDGVSTTLPVSMIATDGGNGNYPKNNLITHIYEDLEEI